MKKQIMASVLLASMMFAVPGYAAYALTPDEDDSEKYKSPLEQSYGPIVNDHPKAESADESEAFAVAAERLIQRDASNKDVSGQKTIIKETTVTSEQDAVPADKTKKEKNQNQIRLTLQRRLRWKKPVRRLRKYCQKQTTILNLLRIKSIPDRSIRQAGRLNPILNQRILGSTCSRKII